jgi:hypothetical protein
LVLALTAAGLGRVIVVPDSAATIAAGLGMAGYGDTVLVKPGQYEENIVWPGTGGIKLYSEAGPDSTVIAGGGNGRVIQFGSGLTRATEIRGFGITGGKTNSGAGIYTQGSPTIAGNKVHDNVCRGGRDYGGGIYCDYGSAPLVTDNEITDNVCSDTNTWNYGGGVFVDMNSAPEICHNLIARNVCSQGYWNYGAGIYVDMRASPVIYQNVIMGNLDTLGDRGHGAGILSEAASSVLVFSNLFINNRNRSGLWNYGGGFEGSGTLISNTFVGNSCIGGNWAYGGAVSVYVNDTVYLKNNVVAQNSAGNGGGICRYDNTGTVLVNQYNDVWNNAGGNYSGCSAGPGDISQDPLFAAGPHGQYCLSQIAAGQPQNSPCRDAGDTLASTSPLNLDSLLRSWTTRTDSFVDVGALDMGYHYPMGLFVGIEERPHAQRMPQVIVAPNPFQTVVSFTIPPAREVRLAVSDVAGRVVYQARRTGGGDVLWNGVDLRGQQVPTGVYFYRLTVDDAEGSGRLVKLR